MKLKKLKIELIKKNITQRKLSIRTQIPEIRLSNAILGKTILKSYERKAIAEYLNVFEEDIFY